MFLHVREARPVGDYRVEVAFNDGRQGVADLSSFLKGPVFGPLQDPDLFARLTVDEETQTVVWPNGADLAPEYLYFRAFQHVPELQQQFAEWGYLDPVESGSSGG